MNSHFPENSQNHHSGICAIIGPPNSGKSTLLNLFLGQKLSIVTPKPQTTRNRISGILTRDDAQILFLDTPGIHKSGKALNRMIVNTAWQTLAEADLILFVLDGSRYSGDRAATRLERDLSSVFQRLKSHSQPLILVVNKIDLVGSRPRLLPLIEQLAGIFPEGEIVPISALKAEHTQELLELLIQKLPLNLPLFPEDQLSTLPMRFFAAEIIREKLIMVLNQEIPYSIAVEIESWQEIPEKNLTEVHAVIHVARQNHKQIVIGKQGSRLKQVGREARLELSSILEQRIHLKLWVKVKPNWHENRSFLQELLPEAKPA
ncbi:MAG: GTPase Era [Desulfohalobiaceae bacterium]|nr:GTPase Era [Desulfohalobiaceae bacterium]